MFPGRLGEEPSWRAVLFEAAPCVLIAIMLKKEKKKKSFAVQRMFFFTETNLRGK